MSTRPGRNDHLIAERSACVSGEDDDPRTINWKHARQHEITMHLWSGIWTYLFEPTLSYHCSADHSR